MKTALPRVRDLLQKVLRAHGAAHGDVLHQVQALFVALDEEITAHLSKEENVLFPYLVSADAHARGKGSMPEGCFPTVRAPIGQMEHEHENAGQALEELRRVPGNYTLPRDACWASLSDSIHPLPPPQADTAVADKAHTVRAADNPLEILLVLMLFSLAPFVLLDAARAELLAPLYIIGRTRWGRSIAWSAFIPQGVTTRESPPSDSCR